MADRFRPDVARMAVRSAIHDLRLWGHMSTTDLPGPSLLAGRYRLVERLGAGGMSVVWRGFDEVLGRQVAVKVLPRSNSADPSFRRRLRAEAQAAARLSHPHITNVYDYGEAMPVGGGAPVPFVVMELVDGESLAAILGRVPTLPWAAAVRICADVAAALAAAHSRGIVHRDVTPANVMLTASGAKVVDFGISALIGENDIDPDGSLLGTPAYLAPERLIGGQVSPATDVYAVGLLIYRTLIGQLPWDAGTTTALLRAHQYTEPEPLPHVDGLPPSVYALVGRCLEKLPADRPSSAELAYVLAGIVAELPKPAAVRGPWVDDEGDTTILPWRHSAAEDVDPAPVPRRSAAANLEPGLVRPAAFDHAAVGGLAHAGARSAPAATAGAVPSQRSGGSEQDIAPIANPAPAGPGGSAGNGGSYGAKRFPSGGENGAGGESGPGGQKGHGGPPNGHSSPHHGQSPANGQSAYGERESFPAQNRAGSASHSRPQRDDGPSAGDRTDEGPGIASAGATWSGNPTTAPAPAPRAAARRRVLVVTAGAVVAVGAAGYGWTTMDGAPAGGNGSALAATGVPRTCFVTYSVLSDKGKKFNADVLVTNNSPQPVDDWSLRFVMPGDQQVASTRGFTLKQQGHDVTAMSSTVIQPLRTAQLKLTGGYRQGNPVPMLFTLNGQLCEALVSEKPGGEAALIPNVPGTTVDHNGFPVPAPNAVPTLSTGPNGVVTVIVTPNPTGTTTVGPVVTTDPGPVVTTTTPPPPSPPPAVETTTAPPPTENEEPPPPPPPPGDEPPPDEGLLDSILGTIDDLT